MAELLRFTNPRAYSLPDEALQEGSPQGFLTENHLFSTEVVEPAVDLERLDRVISDAMSKHGPQETTVDAAMAIPLHQSLPLSRRQAADRGIWAWLGSMRYADFVAHRWGKTKVGLRPLERFTGNRVRQTLARLWWAVELTWSREDGYEWSERLLGLPGFQDFNEATSGRAFSAYPPALRAFIRVLGKAPEKVIRDSSVEFSYILTTMTLEAMNEEELGALLEEIKNRVSGKA